MAFSARPVADRTLGERLRRVREDSKRTVEEVGTVTGIHPRFLTALEEGRYADLPGPLYARRYIGAYARFLGVSEDTALAEFDHEYPAVRSTLRHHPPADAGAHQRAWVTASLGRKLLVGLALLGILLYLAWEAIRLLVPPPLVLSNPPEPFTTTAATVEFIGRTAPEATITLNGEPAPVDARGTFRVSVDLAPGDTTVAVTARRTRGRARTELRHISVPLSTPPGSEADPATPAP